jgi:hypothetical protein
MPGAVSCPLSRLEPIPYNAALLSGWGIFRVRRNLFFSLCLLWASSAVAAPALSIHWKSLRLGQLSGSETKPDATSKQGPVDVELSSPTISYRVSGIEIKEGRLWLQDLFAELRFKSVRAKTVIVADIPRVTFRTVRKEKIIFGKRVVYDEPVAETTTEKRRTETVLFALPDPALIAEVSADKRWSLPLPASLALTLTADRVSVDDRATLADSLCRALDESLSDQFLVEQVAYRLENVSPEAETVLGLLGDSRKSELAAAFREALKREVRSEAFSRRLEDRLSEAMPPLSISGNETLRATLAFPQTGFASLEVGDRWRESPPAAGSTVISASADGLSLALRSVLKSALQSDPAKLLGKTFSLHEGHLLYTPSGESERAHLASILGDLAGTALSPQSLAGVGIDLEGNDASVTLSASGKIEWQTKLVAFSPSGGRTPVPLLLTFSLSADGALALDRIEGTEATGAFALFKAFQTALKLKAAAVLLGRELSEAQAGGNVGFELLLDGPEPILRATIR